MLEHLALTHVGPADALVLSPAPRLNLLAGDNGLGKTFLLDIAWWALTNTWPNLPAIPKRGEEARPSIRYGIRTTAKGPSRFTSPFTFAGQQWQRPKPQRDENLALYARVDGSFAAWDPVRSAGYLFTPDSIWNGLETSGTVLCDGLLRDWITWQSRKPDLFAVLADVLATLSPSPDEVIRPGEPTRVSVKDVREVPTIELPYGTVPVTHASAGMRRVLALSYLLVWSWSEHEAAARLTRREPSRRLVLLIDEVEAHLHPQWQRVLLPALLRAVEHLRPDVEVRILASTHAPLVLASVEPLFDEEQDRVFAFDLEDDHVSVREVPWAKQGDVVGWLTSDVFGLTQARSREADRAIEAAEAFMRGETNQLPDDLRTQDDIHQALVGLLPGHDPFWPRWVVHTEGPEA